MRVEILLLAVIVALSTVPAMARGVDRGGGRGGDHRAYRRPVGGGRYYGRPPIDYGYSPYYAPPVVYAPGIGVNLPGLSVNIR